MIKLLPQITFALFTFPVFAFGVSNQLSINLEGQGRFILTNPAGERIGAQDLDVYEEIASSTLQLNSDGQSVSLLDVTNGTYQLEITGHSYDRDASLEIQYLDDETYQSYPYDIMTKTDSVGVWDIDIDTASTSSRITSTHLVAPVLYHQDGNGTVELVWDININASYYTIYRKAWDFPFYEQMATTTDLTYQTDDAWGTVLDERETIPTDWYSYRVTWTDNDGNESVLSGTVSNSDRDNDGFNDWREINRYQTNPDLADTDGDSLDDFLEINLYRTDPNDVDTDGDSYTDDDELGNNTNPLDPGSYPEQTSCLQDNNGDYVVDGDCVIDTDMVIDGNITILDSALLSIHNSARLLIDLSQNFIRIIRGGTLEVEQGSAISR